MTSPHFNSIEEYVKSQGGTKAIKKILVSNNGVAAVKGIRSIRKWAYQTFGSEKAIHIVSMATPEDIKANAAYIRLADSCIEVEGGMNVNNYANVKVIVDIARECGAHAVWAGWGHASEFPELPDALANTPENITFIGPPAKAMRALGDKISSSIVAESSDVNTLPWSGSGIILDGDMSDVPDDIYNKACVHDADEAVEASKKVGFPLMVKASEGGGGKGIRKVNSEDELPDKFRQVSSEVPGSPIFLMKLSPDSRHLEIQIIADEYGNAIALYGRDCSVQRRHQKIIEEAPIVAAPEETLREMERAAVRLAKSVNYVGVGTVEYLYNDSYYFLELNPRLQVEHPTTEWVTDINIPAAQLQVAMGIPLYKIPDIRSFYKQDPFGSSQIDFDNVQPRAPNGHVVAVRITAENPHNEFRPTSGNIHELTFSSNPNVWGYFSIGSVGGVHEYADSQFGHIFTWGDDREQARKNMAFALSKVNIRGDISTTVEYIKHLIETPTFKNNRLTTTWLDSLISENVELIDKVHWSTAVLCAALHKLTSKFEGNLDKYLWFLERGQCPPGNLLQVEQTVELIYDNVKYAIVGTISGPNQFTLSLGNSHISASIRVLSDGGLLIMGPEGSYVSYAREDPSGMHVTIDGQGCTFPTEHDPSHLRANMSGKLVRYLIPDGSHIEAGQSYAEIEVMKMYLPMVAELSGTINYRAVEGNSLERGDLVAVMDLDDPSQVNRAVRYEGEFDTQPEHPKREQQPHKIVANTIKDLNNILSGYDYPSVIFDTWLKEKLNQLRTVFNPQVIVYEFIDQFSALPLNKQVKEPINGIISKYLQSSSAEDEYVPFPFHEVKATIDKHLEKLSPKSKEEFRKSVAPLMPYLDGSKNSVDVAVERLNRLCQAYLDIEQLFDNVHQREEDVISELRDKHQDALRTVFEIQLSHDRLRKKNKLILGILDLIEELSYVTRFMDTLNKMSEFIGTAYSEVVLRAKLMIMDASLPSFEKKQSEIETIMRNAPSDSNEYALQDLIDQSTFGFDNIVGFFSHSDNDIIKTSVEVYIRKAYRTFDVNIIDINNNDSFWFARWSFKRQASGESDSFRREGIVGSASYDYLSVAAESEGEDYNGHGVMAIFDSVDAIEQHFEQVLSLFEDTEDDYSIRVMKLALRWNDKEIPDEQSLTETFANFLKQKHINKQVRNLDIRRITFVIMVKGQFPFYYTYRQRLGYNEDPIYRNIEPTLAFQLNLRKLSNYNIQRFPIGNPQVHLYYAEPKKNTGDDFFDRRFFVRTLVLRGDIFSKQNPEEFQISEAERYLVHSLNALELALSHDRYRNTYGNHIFINFLPQVIVDPGKVQEVIKRFQDIHAKRLIELRVLEVEVKLVIKTSPNDEQYIPLRFVATNNTGFKLKVDIYQEKKDPVSGRTVYNSIDERYLGHLHGKDINTPHPLLNPVQKKRFRAHMYETTYAYDFPYLFKLALRNIWASHAKEMNTTAPKSGFIDYTELVLNQENELEYVKEDRAGNNDIGMVAWQFSIQTPEYPKGRDMIVICNDITVQTGTFGPKEDMLFYKASELARKLGIPRIYLTANSGARIGLAQEVKECFQVAWVNPNDPTLGFKYLYLTEEDYNRLSANHSVNVEEIQDQGEKRYKIVDIIGATNGLGVENLQGSGMIAGETSRANKDVFTINYVSCRTVGIGAYLVRLGQRTIQNRRPPILLTGAPALNKVLGKEVYTSNVQLGGIQIMYTNGVSHLVVNDDLRGVHSILKWLGYIPRTRGASLPVTPSRDAIDRSIGFKPEKGQQYDPREMLAGKVVDGEWISGFFDKDSFTETLGGWAKSVICGRARLGGMPVATIAVETRTVEQVIPADPADPKSQEKIVQKAGQVWYPDSAYKTAQAIRDFNGEDLPLLIFANWRGFSGGMRDMLDEVLKFGSYIVDALVDYQQPVFVYIPPFGELRGGAWVVVDPTINSDMMEMYAETSSRGGVLEPSGTIEIKFRQKDRIKAMNRIDPEIKSLNAAIETTQDETERQSLKEKLEARQKKLNQTYKSIAVAFADHHDTCGRMKAKGAIREVVDWSNAREYFYWRIKRRMAEMDIIKKITHINKFNEKRNLLKQWIEESKPDKWEDDKSVIDFLESNQDLISRKMQELEESHVEKVATELCHLSVDKMIDACVQFVNSSHGEQATQMRNRIKEKLTQLE